MTPEDQMLLRVANAIEHAGDRYDQGSYACMTPAFEAFLAEGGGQDGIGAYEKRYTQHPCGTAHCIAGWTNMIDRLATRKAVGISDDENAARLLGLEYSESAFLFHGSWTPPQGMSVPEVLRLIARERPDEIPGAVWGYVGFTAFSRGF